MTDSSEINLTLRASDEVSPLFRNIGAFASLASEKTKGLLEWVEKINKAIEAGKFAREWGDTLDKDMNRKAMAAVRFDEALRGLGNTMGGIIDKSSQLGRAVLNAGGKSSLGPVQMANIAGSVLGSRHIDAAAKAALLPDLAAFLDNQWGDFKQPSSRSADALRALFERTNPKDLADYSNVLAYANEMSAYHQGDLGKSNKDFVQAKAYFGDLHSIDGLSGALLAEVFGSLGIKGERMASALGRKLTSSSLFTNKAGKFDPIAGFEALGSAAANPASADYQRLLASLGTAWQKKGSDPQFAALLVQVATQLRDHDLYAEHGKLAQNSIPFAQAQNRALTEQNMILLGTGQQQSVLDDLHKKNEDLKKQNDLLQKNPDLGDTAGKFERFLSGAAKIGGWGLTGLALVKGPQFLKGLLARFGATEAAAGELPTGSLLLRGMKPLPEFALAEEGGGLLARVPEVAAPLLLTYGMARFLSQFTGPRTDPEGHPGMAWIPMGHGGGTWLRMPNLDQSHFGQHRVRSGRMNWWAWDGDNTRVGPALQTVAPFSGTPVRNTVVMQIDGREIGRVANEFFVRSAAGPAAGTSTYDVSHLSPGGNVSFTGH